MPGPSARSWACARPSTSSARWPTPPGRAVSSSASRTRWLRSAWPSALLELGSERAFVVRGERLDELPLDGSGVIFDVSPTGIERREVSSADHGLREAQTEAFIGGDEAANAALIVAILQDRDLGPGHDVVALNAGASLVVAGRAADLRSGVELAVETIASGAAGEQLERLRASARDTRADDPADGGSAAR